MVMTFLVVVACLMPNYTVCNPVISIEVLAPDPAYTCRLRRSWAASSVQGQMEDGWFTFTHCQKMEYVQGSWVLR